MTSSHHRFVAGPLRRASRILCLLATAVPLACSSGGGPAGPGGPTPVASVTIEAASGTLAVGGALQLTVTLRDAAGNVLSNRTITFASSNELIATVTAAGLVQALAAGQVTITATSEGQSGQFSITVNVVPVASVQVDPMAPTIVAGEGVRLTASPRTAAGAAVAGCQIAFSSANDAVATVAADGTVTGVAAGGPIAITAAATCGAAGNAQGAANVTVTPPRFTMVAAGETHTCGLVSTNAVFCWGENDSGQLGDGTTTNRATPVRVTGGHRFKAIYANNRFTCGLTTDDRALCWGQNNHGQLGDGSFTTFRATPAEVTGGRRFTTLGLMEDSACGLIAGGAAFCWGENEDGQLGDGATFDTAAPGPVSGGHSFVSLARSGGEEVDHMCGIRTDGALLCWGANGHGQVGDGTAGVIRTAPTLVVGGRTYTSVWVGHDAACAVATGNLPFCWGRNDSGQLGDGGTSDLFVPTAPATAQTFRLVSIGEHTCALTPASGAFCWGTNDHGQLGDGSNANHFVPGPVGGGHTFSDLVVGHEFVCAVRADGMVLCWGDNAFGQLGDGTLTSRTLPTPVAPLPN